jgi:hypothetical protein
MRSVFVTVGNPGEIGLPLKHDNSNHAAAIYKCYKSKNGSSRADLIDRELELFVEGIAGSVKSVRRKRAVKLVASSWKFIEEGIAPGLVTRSETLWCVSYLRPNFKFTEDVYPRV